MKPKVLYIETGMGFGGSAVSLFEIISNLHNYDPVVVFFSSKDNDFTSLFKSYNTYFLNARFTYLHKAAFYKKLKMLPHIFLSRRIISKLYTLCSAIEDYLLFVKIGKIVKFENISIIHINNCVHPIPLNVARKHDIPVVVHLRGHIDCAGRRKKNHNKYFHTLIAPTKKIRDFAITNLEVENDKIKVIYNSVNPKLYGLAERGKAIRNQYNISDDTVVLGMFARIIPMKGQLELAKAAHKLLRDKQNIICMFIGDISDGDIEYYNTLKSFIDDSGFSDRFIFTGYRNNAPDYYNTVDIAVHGSIANEAFGRVIIESWAAHKPVIATDIAASVELIDHNKTGVLVPTGDIDELSSAILRLISDPTERELIASNGFKRISKTFSSEIVVKSIEDIYNNLLQ